MTQHCHRRQSWMYHRRLNYLVDIAYSFSVRWVLDICSHISRRSSTSKGKHFGNSSFDKWQVIQVKSTKRPIRHANDHHDHDVLPSTTPVDSIFYAFRAIPEITSTKIHCCSSGRRVNQSSFEPFRRVYIRVPEGHRRLIDIASDKIGIDQARRILLRAEIWVRAIECDNVIAEAQWCLSQTWRC